MEWPSDDGSCSQHLSEAACSGPRSPFNRARNECEWTTRSFAKASSSSPSSYSSTSASSANPAAVAVTAGWNSTLVSSMTCVWMPPRFEVISLIVIAFLVVLASAPLLVICGVVFDVVLQAPTPEETEAQHASHSQARRKSVAAVSLADATNAAANASSNTSTAGGRHSLRREKAKVFTRSTFLNEHVHQQAEHARASMLLLMSQQQTPLGKKAANRFATDDAEGIEQFAKDYSAFSSLSVELEAHAATLRPRDVPRFQSQWPLRREGEVVFTGRVAKLTTELDAVKTQADEQIEKLQSTDDIQAGVKILNLFIADLIGRGSRKAQVMMNQIDPFNTRMVVSWGMKMVVLALVLLANATCIFVCMLYGREKGPIWQRGWIAACVMNLAADICVKRLNLCLTINYFIPGVVEIKSTIFFFN